MSFLLAGLAAGSGGGVGEIGGRAGLLRAGVHVAFVVQAHVDHVLVAFGGAGQRLETDVVGAAVARHDQHVDVVLALPPQCPLDPGRRRRAGFQGGLVDRDAHRTVRLRPGDDRDARRRDHSDRVRAHRVQHVAHRQRFAAARAGVVAGAEDVGFVDLVVQLFHRAHLCQTDSATGSSAMAFVTISPIVRADTFTPPTPAR